MAKFTQIIFGSKCPQKSFGGLPLPEFVYLGGKNAKIGLWGHLEVSHYPVSDYIDINIDVCQMQKLLYNPG